MTGDQDPMVKREEDGPTRLTPAQWSGDPRSLPVIYVPVDSVSSEASAIRGVTGLFILVIMITFAIAAAFMAYKTWGPNQLADQVRAEERLTADTSGLIEYMDAVARQNDTMRQHPDLAPPPLPDPHLLEVEIARLRADYQRLHTDNARMSQRR